MIATTIVFILVALSGASNAVADIITHKFGRSIFWHKDPRFWNPAVSWKIAPYIRFTKYKVDAWHIFSSLETVFFAIALCVAYANPPRLKWYFMLLIIGIVWNCSFNLFYNKILIKKK